MAGPLALGKKALLPSPLGWARQTDGPLARINLPQANNTDQRLWVTGVLLLPHNEVCGCNAT